ncbi:MOP flippase family protein [Polaribacter aestuariivivens]|uniref:MOP flippase family protein n=1 Tax=Polaribacter aestuariivivens TaxID=2304626 RepID=UPI003F493571
MNNSTKAINGVKWTTVSKITLTVVAVLKISILARFLDKEDFGLMALVSFVLGIMNLFMNLGLTSAILHKQNITKQEYASLYWINILFSIVILVFMLGASPLIANFYDEAELVKLIPLMGLSVIFSAIGNQFRTVFQKELNFKLISIVEIIGAIISVTLAIILAIKGFGVYTLVYSALLQYLFTNSVYFVKGIYSRGMLFHFKYTETKPFLKIGIYQIGSQLINYTNRDVDILLIGKFFGSEILGGYSLAKQLAARPAQIINPILTSVASPYFSIYQNNISQLKEKYMSVLKIISSVNIMAYLFLALFASQIIYLFYGEGFENIVILVQILSGYMFLRSLANPVGSLVVALGRTDIEFYWNLLVLFLMPIMIFIGAQFSVEMVALSLLIAMLLFTFLSWRIFVFRLIGVSFVEYFKGIIPSVKALINITKRFLIKK